MAALGIALLASLGAIVVDVEGPATEVVALRDGVVRASARVEGGRAVLEGLREGAWDLQARGPGCASELRTGVRAVAGDRRTADARLVARAAHPVEVRARPGSTAWIGGVPLDASWNLVPGGLHRLIVDHPAQVSTRARLLRVDGPLTTTVEQEPGLVVTGTVVDAAGEPVEGARIRVFADGVPVSREGGSDAAGRFGVSGFSGDVIAVEVAARGCATALRRVEFFPGDERARLDVVLRPGCGVAVSARSEGRLRLDAEAILLPEWVSFSLDEPRLRASHLPARRTGGRVLRFPGLTPGRRYRLLVSAPGCLPVETAPFPAPVAGRTLNLPDVELPRAVALTGRVEPPTGGRVVACTGADGTTTDRTDRHGRFRIDGRAPGPHSVAILDAAADGWDGTLPHAAPLVLREREEGATLSVVVHDADDRPLPAVLVDALGHRAVTDAQGCATIGHLPASATDVRVVMTPGPACRALAEDGHLPLSATWSAAEGVLRVRLARAGRLALRFVDMPAPLARATLHLADAQGDRRTLRLPRGATGADVEDLPVGAWRVDLAAPRLLGTGQPLVEAVAGESEPAPVRIVPGRSVRGVVVRRRTESDAAGAPRVTDAPVERGRVTLFDPDPRRAMATTPVDADGSFLLEGLPPGPVLLAVWAPGLPVDVVRVDLGVADRDGLVLALKEASEARARATDPAGRPVAGARARRVVHETGAERSDLVAVGAYRRVVADDAEIDRLALDFASLREPGGWVVVPFLAPGSWDLFLDAEGFLEGRVGVRAPLPETLLELRRMFPERTADLWPQVRLEPASGGTKD